MKIPPTHPLPFEGGGRGRGGCNYFLSNLIVTTGLKGTGIVEEIKGILNYNGISTEIYDKVTSNPKDYEVAEAYKIFMDTQCDGVVSIGGGSSHDCAKGVRAI